MIDEVVGEDESPPLASLMELVGVLIEKYEDEHVPELAVEWSHILRTKRGSSPSGQYPRTVL